MSSSGSSNSMQSELSPFSSTSTSSPPESESEFGSKSSNITLSTSTSTSSEFPEIHDNVVRKIVEICNQIEVGYTINSSQEIKIDKLK